MGSAIFNESEVQYNEYEVNDISPKAKFTGWAFERDATGKITHVVARLPIEEDGKTAKGQIRWYTSGGFLNIENEADEKMAVSCTVFKAKK
jgi:hypothetical protein